MKNKLALIGMIGLALSVQGCMSRFDMGPLSSQPQVSLSQSSYGAADMLATQAQNIISQNTTIVAEPLAHLKQPGVETLLGKQLGNNMAARFVQLGYTVLETPPAGQTNYSKLGGNYTQLGDDILANLRIVDNTSGRIQAAHEYKLPFTKEVRRLLDADKPEEEKKGGLGNIFGSGWAE